MIEKNKEVWIKCRATKGCEGNRAEIIKITEVDLAVSTNQNAIPNNKIIQYKCLTCGKEFHITQ